MRAILLVGLIGMAGAAVLLFPSTLADVSSPTADCDVTFNGESAKVLASTTGTNRSALFLDRNGSVDVVVETEHRITGYKFVLKYGPATMPVYSGSGGGTDPNRDAVELDASRYAKYGAGLYTLHGNVSMRDGNGERHDCTVAVLMHVDGNPLASLVGLVAAGAALGGLAGLIQSAVGLYMDSKEVIDSVKDIREFYGVARHKP